MAKFAKCGYGSQGQGLGKTTDGYTYVVNDNVRTGDVIQVVATSTRPDGNGGRISTGKKFATTAVPLHTYKETSKKGQLAKQEVEQKGKEITPSYSGKELGATGSRATQPIGTDGKRTISEYAMATRAGNLAMYKQDHPDAQFTQKSQETFDAYSKQFMNKGEQ